ncbi:MAG: hypothetical protein ACI9CD_000641 [Candidatus Deianiraeaceae bacterium]|jgi:hypothetical protein
MALKRFGLLPKEEGFLNPYKLAVLLLRKFQSKVI